MQKGLNAEGAGGGHTEMTTGQQTRTQRETEKNQRNDRLQSQPSPGTTASIVAEKRQMGAPVKEDFSDATAIGQVNAQHSSTPKHWSGRPPPLPIIALKTHVTYSLLFILTAIKNSPCAEAETPHLDIRSIVKSRERPQKAICYVLYTLSHPWLSIVCVWRMAFED